MQRNTMVGALSHCSEPMTCRTFTPGGSSCKSPGGSGYLSAYLDVTQTSDSNCVNGDSGTLKK